jgi:hypothetical protein
LKTPRDEAPAVTKSLETGGLLSRAVLKVDCIDLVKIGVRLLRLVKGWRNFFGGGLLASDERFFYRRKRAAKAFAGDLASIKRKQVAFGPQKFLFDFVG